MRLTPWRKRQELSPEIGVSWPRLRDRMDRLFESVFGEPWRDFGSETTGGWIPDIDVKEREKSIEVRAEVPGMDPKDIEISVQGDVLTISGEKKVEKEEKQENYYCSECRYGAFHRTVDLPEGADPDKVTAEYDKGVLQIRIAKKEGVVPKRVTVKPVEAKGTAGGAQKSA